jgi:hypothetical protein
MRQRRIASSPPLLPPAALFSKKIYPHSTFRGKLSPEETMNDNKLIGGISGLYMRAHNKHIGGRVYRGGSASVSGEAEDLFALWLDGVLKAHDVLIWVNPTITFDTHVKTSATGKKRADYFKPDICVVEGGKGREKTVRLLLELKMDLSRRRDFDTYAKGRGDILRKPRGAKAHCRVDGAAYCLSFAKGLAWIYALFSPEYCRKDRMEEFKKEFGSSFFVLGNGHPNDDPASFKPDPGAFEALKTKILSSI